MLRWWKKKPHGTVADRSSSFGISSTDVGRGFSRGFLLACVAGRASTSTLFGAPDAHAPPRPATLTVAVFRTTGGTSDRPLVTVQCTQQCVQIYQVNSNTTSKIQTMMTTPQIHMRKVHCYPHGRVVEQGLTSHQTHYRSYRGRVFMGQMTQPTESKH